jgi:type IV secretion system protein VirB10
LPANTLFISLINIAPIFLSAVIVLQILWSRIITPKGIVITINAELSDQMGRSGLAGEIDTKFLDKYGMTLLFSTISAVAQFKFNTNKNQEIIANTYGKDLANVSAKILSENINIKPVISILAQSHAIFIPKFRINFTS